MSAQAASSPGYAPGETAILFVDSCNDFLPEDGKFWPLVSDFAVSVRLHDDLRAVVVAARNVGVAIFIAPHDRCAADADVKDPAFAHAITITSSLIPALRAP